MHALIAVFLLLTLSAVQVGGGADIFGYRDDCGAVHAMTGDLSAGDFEDSWDKLVALSFPAFSPARLIPPPVHSSLFAAMPIASPEKETIGSFSARGSPPGIRLFGTRYVAWAG